MSLMGQGFEIADSALNSGQRLTIARWDTGRAGPLLGLSLSRTLGLGLPGLQFLFLLLLSGQSLLLGLSVAGFVLANELLGNQANNSARNEKQQDHVQELHFALFIGSFNVDKESTAMAGRAHLGSVSGRPWTLGTNLPDGAPVDGGGVVSNRRSLATVCNAATPKQSSTVF